ncbi:MAG: bifunctional 3,4-dihydroxy-2-butanone 4-phosphate synthase/GTP cyclohydrolase II [Elusimicrobia bacterium GWA2_69_24]|nr:MAG: bifunctional 3,4-dihydroxy-2-butanone 4-phosphate synthase/GTP cyclohydrolase II [Elusimicrobia bacterium GWA2_69_24]
MAAQRTTPAAINFMARHGCGLICVPMSGRDLDRLRIEPMVPAGEEGPGRDTAFSVSVDARRGTTTGISAADRARTVRRLISPRSRAEDFLRPGHIFPLRAREGGVLVRAGHTEAAVDLARLAGLEPAGTICEILNPDGTMARLPQLARFAKRHGLRLITIKSLIEHRRANEKLVRSLGSCRIPTRHGEFDLTVYEESLSGRQHLALSMGTLRDVRGVLVRVHSSCLTGDTLFSLRCDCGPQLEAGMRAIAKEKRGVLLYLSQEGRGIGLAQKVRAYALQDGGLDTVEANEALGFKADLREYGIGAQILADLGLGEIRLLTNNPRKIVGIGGFGLRVVGRVPLQIRPNAHNARYFDTKRLKLGHLLDHAHPAQEPRPHFSLTEHLDGKRKK